MKAIKGNITGKVQGVGFRMYIYRQADRLGLSGWVSNNPNGTVDFHAEGSDVELSYFTDLVRRGNDFCDVESLEYTECETENLTTFKVID
ncbi:acylphosphatase [Thiospirochaeta perfilievii]|uniref:acylphosphatase n=1 Tax=Thiospirochaeta perfilievii TaxID=252967 RepID=A0A5C1QD97_9SPIO|nr:acylphosphatase [Thiospirochaeta perfilievii]QEN05387.1 acylphosphatase [Thiospirochaeta perfilievii]